MIKIFKGIILNIIDSSDISKLTYSINIMLSISNLKFDDLAIFLLSCREVSNCCNTFNR